MNQMQSRAKKDKTLQMQMAKLRRTVLDVKT